MEMFLYTQLTEQQFNYCYLGDGTRNEIKDVWKVRTFRVISKEMCSNFSNGRSLKGDWEHVKHEINNKIPTRGRDY